MIKLFLIIFFMTPICFFTHRCIVFQYIYIFIYIIIMVSRFNVFVSNISYIFGFDSYSYGLLILRFIISSLIIMSMSSSKWINMFLFINLLLTFSLILIFSSLYFLYIYVSFEFVLIPLFILILGWGYQPERLMAGLYLFFYTVLVSLPVLFFILYLYNLIGSVFFDYIYNSDCKYILFHLILLLVFIVKFPIYLLHFWLPKAHVQAPVSGSILLAGVILKIGGYGVIRTIWIYEDIFICNSYIWFCFGLLGSFFISFVCLIQSDIKCLIAYSSVCHIGIVIIGLITIDSWGIIGSYILILGHGFCSSGLFYICNLFYIRSNSRRFYINKGIINYIPRSCLFYFLLCSFNMRCPPRLNFFSELIILSRIIKFWLGSFFIFICISFLCACFRYYLYSYVQHGLYHNLYSFSVISVIEFLCLFMHLIPLFSIPLFFISLI